MTMMNYVYFSLVFVVLVVIAIFMVNFISRVSTSFKMNMMLADREYAKLREFCINNKVKSLPCNPGLMHPGLKNYFNVERGPVGYKISPRTFCDGPTFVDMCKEDAKIFIDSKDVDGLIGVIYSLEDVGISLLEMPEWSDDLAIWLEESGFFYQRLDRRYSDDTVPAGQSCYGVMIGVNQY